MRLSNAQSSFFPLFLIISLTLLPKINAGAPNTRFANVLAFNAYRHSPASFDQTGDDYNEIGVDICKRDSGLTGSLSLPAFNFRDISENANLKPGVFWVVKNNCKLYPRRPIIPARFHNIVLNHRIRLTFKLLKLVIVPLWYSK